MGNLDSPPDFAPVPSKSLVSPDWIYIHLPPGTLPWARRSNKCSASAAAAIGDVELGPTVSGAVSEREADFAGVEACEGDPLELVLGVGATASKFLRPLHKPINMTAPLVSKRARAQRRLSGRDVGSP